MTHKNNAKYQAEYRARLKARGLVQVIVWVPKSAVSRLKAYVAKLVRGADSAGGGAMSEEFWKDRAGSYRARAVEAEAGISTLAVEINALRARLAEAERLVRDLYQVAYLDTHGVGFERKVRDDAETFLRGSVNGEQSHG